MKILMVTRETQADKRYGLGRSLTPLIAEFKRRGIDADVICQADLGVRALLWQGKLQQLSHRLLDRLNGQTDFATLFSVVLERFNMGRLAAKVCSKNHFTHVHCHDPIIAAGYRFFSLLSLSAQVRWGITEHGFGSYSQAIYADGVRMGPRILSLLTRWEAHTLSQAAWVVTPSHSAALQLAKDLGCPSIADTWHVIYHARPDINCYQKQEARQQLSWTDEHFYLLSVGRIAPVKQFPLLVEACAKAANAKPVQLVILGEGEYESLQDLGKRLKLKRPIQFASTDNVGLYLSAADLYVSTSASESFGLANLEAMTAGVAALCTAVGAVPEIVDTGGVLVAANLEAITSALQHLMTDNDARLAIAERGLQRAQSWPDIKTIADHYEKIYQ
ncbi:MAG: glycosyltransferase family 4 protein [Methylobacter sp.]|nr:glycosyltransferase family 4 protein [Candidatus Methylobacter titanis]